MNRRKQQQVFVYVILACVALVILIIAIASGGGGTRVPGAVGLVTQYEPIIPATTKVLSAATTQNLTISPDSATYTFSQSTPELQALKVGDVIVSDTIPQAQEGFLRQVINISTSNGQVVIQTTPAVLSQAIQQGTIHVQQQLTPTDVRASSQLEGLSYKLASPNKVLDEFSVQVSDVVVYDKDGDLATQTDQVRLNGEIAFAPDLTFDLAIKDFVLQQALFQIDLEKTTKLEVEVGFDVELWDEKVEIQRYWLKPIVVFVGHVPVVITPVVSVNVGTDGEISFGARSSYNWVETYRAGLKYDHGMWQRISEHTGPDDAIPGPIEFFAGGSSKGFVGPQFSLLIYGMVGPYATAQPNLELEIDPFPQWGFYLGVTVNVGIRFEFWGEDIADYDAEVISFRILITKGGSPPPTITPTDTPEGGVITPAIPTTPPPSFSADTATVLVLDSSGSMDEQDVSGYTKLEAAKQAGQRILDILEAESQASGGVVSQIGLVRFSTVTEIVLGLTNDIAAARNALNSLYSQDMTGMPDGLQAGISVLESRPPASKPIIILLSDGLPNVGLGGNTYDDYEAIKQQVIDLSTQAGGKGICVYTVGFGDSGTFGNMSIDEDFLRAVAQASGCGEYYNAQNATQLANVYVELRHTSTGNVLLSQSGNIAQGEQLTVATVDVPGNQAQMLYTLNWPGSQLSAILVDPNGQQVGSGYPGASFLTTSSLASVIVQNPLAGAWQVQAQGVDVPEGTTIYNAVLSVRPSPITPTPLPQPTLIPTPIPLMPSAPGFPVALVLLILGGGAVAIYVLYSTTRRNRQRTETEVPPTAASGAAQLVIVSGPNMGQSISLYDGLTIGRSQTSGLFLADTSVSRQHAILRYSQGGWFIQDQGSKGGMYVNGQRLPAARLKAGDRITIGSTTIEFRG